MNYEDVVFGRRSIRAFQQKPVLRSVIENVIALATRAPSSMNTQPWLSMAIYFDPPLANKIDPPFIV